MYWSTGNPTVTVGGSRVTSVLAATEGEWKQYRIDLSGRAGKTVTILFESGGYLDDVTLEAR